MSRTAIYFLLILTPIMAVLLAFLGFETLHSNLLGWFLLLTGSVYALSFVLISIVRYKRVRDQIRESQHGTSVLQEEKGDRSFWFITLGIAAVFFLSPIEHLYFAIFTFNESWMQFIGSGLVLSGIILFIWARWALGIHYSGHIQVKQYQELVQRGPYHIIRHPAYAGYLLMAIGVSLGYLSLLGFLCVLILVLPAIVYRIRLEDCYLAEHFGAAFKAYAQKRKRLLPGIW